MAKQLKDVKPADESVMPSWFTPIWAELRRTFLIGTFAAGLIVAGLNWYRSTFPSADPAPATAAQLNTQTAVIQDQVESTQRVVHDALQSYTDSLTMVRADVEETMAKPILQSILDLNRQLGQLRKGQQHTTDAVDLQRTNNEATTRELLDRINALQQPASEDLFRQVIDKLEHQERVINELKNQRPTTKGKF